MNKMKRTIRGFLALTLAVALCLLPGAPALAGSGAGYVDAVLVCSGEPGEYGVVALRNDGTLGAAGLPKEAEAELADLHASAKPAQSSAPMKRTRRPLMT